MVLTKFGKKVFEKHMKSFSLKNITFTKDEVIINKKKETN